jgi:hypothetical protein
MADDGRGREITIPGILISYEDGAKLKDYYRKYKDDPEQLKKIVLEVNFEMEHPSNTVKYDLYMTSDNEQIYRLFQDFYHLSKELIPQTNLTVHYITYQSPFYNTGMNFVSSNCLGNGKYCNTPGKFNTTDGTLIVIENIKQKCVYKYAYEQEKNPVLYWDYIINFYLLCLDKANPEFTRECSSIASLDSKLPNDIINKCIYDSWNASEEKKKQADFELYSGNTLLDQDNEDRKTYALSFIPSLVINNRTFWGSWTADNVFEAICAGFKKKPEICYSQGAFKKAKMSTFSIVMIVLVIVVVNAIIFYFCRNYIRKKIVERIESTDINHKINTVVTSYLALRDNNNSKTSI